MESEYSDCLKTRDVCNLFCQVWGDNASWEAINLEGQTHEANIPRLDTSRAKSRLEWRPVWDARRAVKETVHWYKAFAEGGDMKKFTEFQIRHYMK